MLSCDWSSDVCSSDLKSLVTQVKKLADPQYRSDDNKEDRLSNLSYGEPPRTSSGLSFHGGASPIPIPVPAPASLIPGPSSGLPSSSESSFDKENSAPGTQQSIVMELVAIVEEDILDRNEEAGHVMARRVQDELVRSVLNQRCQSKCQSHSTLRLPTCCEHLLAVRATLPLQFLVLKSRSSGSRTIHARDNPHKG